MSQLVHAELYREIDPARGPFEPSGAHIIPLKTEKNPKATRHIDKTRQDAMPVAERPRVIEAQSRA